MFFPRLIFLLFIICIGGAAYGQNSRTIYFAANGTVSAPATASYYSKIIQNTNDTSQYTVDTFFLAGNRKESGSYQAKQFPVAWEKLYEPSFQGAIKDGLFLEYFQNKQKKFEGRFRQGLGEGIHRSWYESGKLLSEITLLNGRNEGKVTSYYENGKINTQYEAKNGLAEGELVEYHSDGRKKAKAKFTKGVLEGQVTLFGPDDREIPKK